MTFAIYKFLNGSISPRGLKQYEQVHPYCVSNFVVLKSQQSITKARKSQLCLVFFLFLKCILQVYYMNSFFRKTTKHFVFLIVKILSFNSIFAFCFVYLFIYFYFVCTLRLDYLFSYFCPFFIIKPLWFCFFAYFRVSLFLLFVHFL